MAKRDSTRGSLVPAVGCVRRSTDMQEASIPEQKREVAKYCDCNGLTVVRWVEQTIGGAKDKRPKFQKLLLQLGRPDRDFQALVWWNWKRFSRKDSFGVAKILD